MVIDKNTYKIVKLNKVLSTYSVVREVREIVNY